MQRISEETINDLAKHIGRGGKHTLLVGNAGLGKSMIAQRVQDYMSPLTEGQQEVFDIYKAAGLSGNLSFCGLKRPFRAPHHTCSMVSLIGSKPKPPVLLPRFGELSLAHRGLFLLDEAPEFRRDCLEQVAFTVKNKHVTHGMGNIGWPNWYYPADFQLVATMSPCPCGWLNRSEQCQCSDSQIERYKARVKILPFDEVIELHDDGSPVTVSPKHFFASAQRTWCEHEDCTNIATQVGWIGERRAHLCLDHYVKPQHS